MKFKVILPKQAQKDLKKIEKKYHSKIFNALKALSTNPHLGKKLSGDYKKAWSYRVWPYRIIYMLRKKELLIIIIRIKHRQSAYK